MKNNPKIYFIFLFFSLNAFAQVKISDQGNSSPAASSVMEIESNSKGLLIPRLTTSQRDAIASPADGLLIFNSSTKKFEFNLQSGQANTWTALGGTDTSSLSRRIDAKLAGTTTAYGQVVEGLGGDAYDGTTNRAAFTIRSTSPSNLSEWHQGLHVLRSTMPQNTRNMIAFGNHYSARNSGYISFKNAGSTNNSGSFSNSVSLGMHSVDDVITFDGNRNITLGGPSSISNSATFSGVNATNFPSTGLTVSNNSIAITSGGAAYPSEASHSTTGFLSKYTYKTNLNNSADYVRSGATVNFYNRLEGEFGNALRAKYEKLLFTGNGTANNGSNEQFEMGYIITTVYNGTRTENPFLNMNFLSGILRFGNSSEDAKSLYIDRTNGRFGIGAATDVNYKLNVGGNTQISGNTRITGTLGLSSAAGTATLTNGSVSVSKPDLTASSIVILTPQAQTSEVFSVSKTAGTGFTIYSSDGSSTKTVGYLIIN